MQGQILYFVRTIATVRNIKNELYFTCHASTVVFVQLIFYTVLEPTPGMHCPLASGLGTTFSRHLHSLPLAQVLAQFKFCNQMADPDVIA